MSDATPGTIVTVGYVPHVLNIGNLRGKPFIQFHPDGTIVLAGDARPDEAAQEMMALLVPLFAAHCGQLRGQVRAFHGANGVADPPMPTVPQDDRVRFRARLIAEEALETIAAMFSDGKGYQSALDRIGFALPSFIKEASRFARRDILRAYARNQARRGSPWPTFLPSPLACQACGAPAAGREDGSGQVESRDAGR